MAFGRLRMPPLPGKDPKTRSGGADMAKKDIKVGYGVDIDAVAGWIGSYGGQDSPDDITRGVYAGKVGVPRLIKLFKKFDIQATWFTPGHSAEPFPREMKQIVDEGHEIGL